MPAEDNQHPAGIPRDVVQGICLDYTGRTPQAQRETLIVAHLNADRQAINRQVHEALQQSGALRADTLPLSVLEPVRTTPGELRSARGFVAHVGKTAVMNGQYYTVTQADTENGTVTLLDEEGKTKMIACAENSTQAISLYQPHQIAVSTGDRMRFTRSDNERGYVANSQWTVSSTRDGHLTLTNSEGQTRRLDPAKCTEDRHVDLAYAVTAYGAQGASARYVIALEGVGGSRKAMATQEGGYVTLSRAREHVQVYTDNREGWLNALDKQSQKQTAHDLLLHTDDQVARTAARLMSTAKPLQQHALWRQLLKRNGLNGGESMARFITPGRQYPAPHLMLPLWDSNGQKAGVYLDAVSMKENGGDVSLRHQPRIMGSDDARFAGLQTSRNGETRLASDMHEGFRLAQAHPDSGVIVRLKGDGIPYNLQRITGGVLVPEPDAVRQTEKPDDEPLPFIPDEAQKLAEALEKKMREAIQRPETEKQELAMKQAMESLHASKEDINLKMLTEAGKNKGDATFDKVVHQLTQAKMQERLQNMERDIVKEKTFGE